MIKVPLLECKSGTIALVWFPYSLHISYLNHIINCASIHYDCTLKTQEFRTKDFVVRSTHSIEHQKCKYCVGRCAVHLLAVLVHLAHTTIKWKTNVDDFVK